MGSRSLALVTDAELGVNMERRLSASEPTREEVAINTTFAEAVLVAFRTLEPAKTAIDEIVSLVIAAVPPAYRTALPAEVETALRFWEEKGQISFESFKQLAAV